MVPELNLTWQVGEDLKLSMVYKTTSSPNGLDLTGYSLRMDIGFPVEGPATESGSLVVLNSAAIPDTDPLKSGAQADTSDFEVTLGSQGQIEITIGRAVTLPPSRIWGKLTDNPPVNIFDYDIFLRDPQGKQRKILRGQIVLENSVTLWA